MNEWQGRRCGHNYTPAECPADKCAIRDGLREIIAKIDNIVELGNRLNDPAPIALAMSLALTSIHNRLNDPAPIALAMSLALTSIHAKAIKLLSPTPGAGGAA